MTRHEVQLLWRPQARLGHADAATTLREYSYVIPGTDNHIADHIDHHLDRCRLTDHDE
ncbi:MAG: hypothetical protein OSB43_12940 [Nocardioides sp.]|uniref:hypothetical protein n=1 Tax=Nocardioides sp. TaxID=35761 RepID=UPI002389FFA1|nr:hypothetical protein [Nocardioides sp.]MDE0777172.1 hypothetical protein [Nocardioides sp.]